MSGAALWPGRPDWVIELGQVGGQVCGDLAVAAPAGGGWFVRPDLGERRLLVSCSSVAGRRRDVIVAAALTVAPLWPGWLERWRVGSTIWVPGLSVTHDHVSMVELAGGVVDGRRWWSRGEVVID